MGRAGGSRESRGHRVNFKGLFDGFRARAAALLRDLDKPWALYVGGYIPSLAACVYHTYTRTRTAHIEASANQFSSVYSTASGAGIIKCIAGKNRRKIKGEGGRHARTHAPKCGYIARDGQLCACARTRGKSTHTGDEERKRRHGAVEIRRLGGEAAGAVRVQRERAATRKREINDRW